MKRSSISDSLRIARKRYADGGVTPASLARAWTPPEEALNPEASKFVQEYPEKFGEALASAPEKIYDVVKYPGQVLYGEKPYDEDEAVKWAADASGMLQTGGIGGAAARTGETVLGSGPVRLVKDNRITQLKESAQRIKAGEGSAAEHAELVSQFKPVRAYDAPVAPATYDEMYAALSKDKLEKLGAPRELPEGYPAAVRLDIPAYQKNDTWVVSVHDPKTDYSAGKVIGYDSVAHLDAPTFGVQPKGAVNIAAGKPKSTIATVQGGWKPTTPEDAYALAQKIHNDPAWAQVGMDPERHAYFYNRATMEPITSAEEALHIGPLVYAKNPVVGKVKDYPFARGGNVDEALSVARRRYADGGAPSHMAFGGFDRDFNFDRARSAQQQMNPASPSAVAPPDPTPPIVQGTASNGGDEGAGGGTSIGNLGPDTQSDPAAIGSASAPLPPHKPLYLQPFDYSQYSDPLAARYAFWSKSTSPAVASAMMGNFQTESFNNPNQLQTSTGSATGKPIFDKNNMPTGFGSAMWGQTRLTNPANDPSKMGLFDFAKTTGYDPNSIEGQDRFALYELTQNPEYKSVYSDVMKSGMDIPKATYLLGSQYFRPADLDASLKQRQQQAATYDSMYSPAATAQKQAAMQAGIDQFQKSGGWSWIDQYKKDQAQPTVAQNLKDWHAPTATAAISATKPGASTSNSSPLADVGFNPIANTSVNDSIMQQSNDWQNQQIQNNLSQNNSLPSFATDYYNQNVNDLTIGAQNASAPWISPNLGDTSYLSGSSASPFPEPSYLTIFGPGNTDMSPPPMEASPAPAPAPAPTGEADGGSVGFNPMFEGDSEAMQSRAKQLARQAYTDPKSFSSSDRKEWNELAGRYNLPPSSASQNTYEDQVEQSMSALQDGPSASQKSRSYNRGGEVNIKKALDVVERKNGGKVKYQLKPDNDSRKHAGYKDDGGRMTWMSPDKFLDQTQKMEMDKKDKKSIKRFEKKIKKGKKLNPLAIYSSGGQDGRHRATAAKHEGISKVPVITWPKKAGGGSIVDRALVVASKPANRQRGRP
ncbi:hypothetical protein UFOVP231_9 [uncultured Caudovirales phage]|uniref:Phage tail lysozyme domain-containing protein n=1 Tax=uncultured Caudovirales phage TaxID=2100421 RepID=A0A6J7WUW8_9CAUD|nr:hypothetical protein UFOVP231_9 [uncultured Caudovirales phage]